MFVYTCVFVYHRIKTDTDYIYVYTVYNVLFVTGMFYLLLVCFICYWYV